MTDAIRLALGVALCAAGVVVAAAIVPVGMRLDAEGLRGAARLDATLGILALGLAAYLFLRGGIREVARVARSRRGARDALARADRGLGDA